MKLRLTGRIVDHLRGSQAWQVRDGSDPDAEALMHKVAAAAVRKDRSVIVDLTAAEAAVLAEYAEILVIGARDNLDPYGRDTWASDMAEINTGEALLRRIANGGTR